MTSIISTTTLPSAKYKTVDYVLVSNISDEFEENRRIFEEGLQDIGLILEHHKVYTEKEDLQFTLIQAPFELLLEYYEIFNFRMPLKEKQKITRQSAFNISEENPSRWRESKRRVCGKIKAMFKNIYQYFIQEDAESNGKHTLFDVYRADKSYLFDLEHEYFRSSSARITVVNHLLNYQKWTHDEVNPDNVTLAQILEKKIYLAAYPPHEGDFTEEGTPRYNLLQKWMKLSVWEAKEPLDDVEKYFGGRYASYFAWIGCYSRLLLIPSIFGILTLLYGLCTLPADSFSQDVCRSKNITMCPTCDYECSFYSLSNNCIYVKIAHLFDNSFSPVFAFLMAIWVTIYVQIWKRKSAVLKYKWGLHQLSVDDIPTRAKYLAALVQNEKRKFSFCRDRLPHIVVSYVTILFFITVIIIATIVVAIYHLWISNVGHTVDSSSWIAHYWFLIQNLSSALLNLTTIQFLDSLYPKVALYLNNLELHRTKYEFERALSVKIYVFKFVNTYSSILYTALFKGKFVGQPGHYNRIFGVRQEECGYGGCMMELSIQLATIMIGKQIIELFTDYATPAISYLIEEKNDTSESHPLPRDIPPQCFNDYKLSDYDRQGKGLCEEYLRTVIQFGFVTLFIPAFPLVPLCAFIADTVKIRLDARKLLKYYRRPVPTRFPTTDMWVQIMDSVGDLSVLVNGIILAFTTDFIPRLIYQIHTGGSDQGFLMASLSSINVTELEPESIPAGTSSAQIQTCSYDILQEIPSSSNSFAVKPALYWEVLMARFVFLIMYQKNASIYVTNFPFSSNILIWVFNRIVYSWIFILLKVQDNIVYAIKLIIKYWIPTEPYSLHELMKEDNDRIMNLIVEATKKRKHNPQKRDTNTPEAGTSCSNVEILHESIDVGLSRLVS